MHYDLLEEVNMLAERRPYASAWTNDQLSSSLRDYGASEHWVE